MKIISKELENIETLDKVKLLDFIEIYRGAYF